MWLLYRLRTRLLPSWLDVERTKATILMMFQLLVLGMSVTSLNTYTRSTSGVRLASPFEGMISCHRHEPVLQTSLGSAQRSSVQFTLCILVFPRLIVRSARLITGFQCPVSWSPTPLHPGTCVSLCGQEVATKYVGKKITDKSSNDDGHSPRPGGVWTHTPVAPAHPLPPHTPGNQNAANEHTVTTRPVLNPKSCVERVRRRSSGAKRKPGFLVAAT